MRAYHFASEGGVRGFLTGCFLLLAVFDQTAAAASCMPFVRTFHNQTVDGYMTVRSGKRCNITFRSLGPTETVTIVQRSSSGSVTLGGVGRVTYHARQGFVGKDTFIYARRGRDRFGSESNRQVRINVTVNP
jgi:hypothetical protein